MIHFNPSSFFHSLTPAMPCEAPAPAARAYGRADHARMMAHAARRRSAASSRGEDARYWKACAPAAVARAAAIRSERGFARLP